MIVKNRKESEELQMLNSLNNRMDLPEKDRLHYFSLKKGFEGEVLFDRYLENLRCDCLILNDLLLKINHTTFQIDSLMIMPDTIFVFEVKNYEGDYYYDPPTDKIFPMKSKDVEIVNPLGQLKRSETLLGQLLHRIGFKFPIKSFVIFINPNFTLYQAPINEPIIYPTQISRFIHGLNVTRSRITNKEKLLAEKLMSHHMSKSEYSNIPSFEYEQLKKGITCAVCRSFLVSVEGRSCVCVACGHSEGITAAVMRSVGEFKLLFPEAKITTSGIFDWCRVVESRKRIQRILERNLNTEGKKRGKFYK